MKKVIVVLVMALLTANSFGTWNTLNWDIKYDATVLPNVAGAVQAWNGTAYVAAAQFTQTNASNSVPTVSGGIFSSNTITAPVPNSTANWLRGFTSGYPTGAVMPDSTGTKAYVVETKIKVLDTEGASLGLLTVEEGTTGITRSIAFGFYRPTTLVDLGAGRILTPGLWVYLGGNNTQYTKVDAEGVSDFHSYRILADNIGTKLFIDGATTAAQTMAFGTTLSKNAFIFGDASSTQDVSYQLDYIGIKSASSNGYTTLIPEPATVLVLGIGSLCLRLRRKLS